MSKQTKQQLLHPKDPGSAITHFIGMVLIALGMLPLLWHTFIHSSHIEISVFSMFIFCVSMFLLYAASTSYHTFNLTKAINKRLKKCDHMMIFVMIAGSYTPVCLVVLGNHLGYTMCLIVWSIAILGIVVGLLIAWSMWISYQVMVGGVLYGAFCLEDILEIS